MMLGIAIQQVTWIISDQIESYAGKVYHDSVNLGSYIVIIFCFMFWYLRD